MTDKTALAVIFDAYDAACDARDAARDARAAYDAARAARAQNRLLPLSVNGGIKNER